MMAKRQLPHPVTGEMVEVDVVNIVEISERPTTITLADGTVLRIKVDVVEVSRFLGEDDYDQDGNPLYNVRHGVLMNVLHAPNGVKRAG